MKEKKWIAGIWYLLVQNIITNTAMNEWMHVTHSPFVSVARIRVQEDDEETRKMETKRATTRKHDEKMKAKALSSRMKSDH